MTSIAKRALRFLENLEDDALRSFIEEIEVLEPEEDDEMTDEEVFVRLLRDDELAAEARAASLPFKDTLWREAIAPPLDAATTDGGVRMSTEYTKEALDRIVAVARELVATGRGFSPDVAFGIAIGFEHYRAKFLAAHGRAEETAE